MYKRQIPGCPGVGEKTAQKLIAQYGSIENLLSHSAELKGALKTKVDVYKRQAQARTQAAVLTAQENAQREIEEAKARKVEPVSYTHLHSKKVQTE